MGVLFLYESSDFIYDEKKIILVHIRVSDNFEINMLYIAF